MDEKLKKAKDILIKYNQEHLLNFYDEITDEQKEILLNEIFRINFDEILTLYTKSLNNQNIDTNFKVSPIKHIEKDKLTNLEIENYTKIGEEKIKSNVFAVVTMAGRSRNKIRIQRSKRNLRNRF